MRKIKEIGLIIVQIIGIDLNRQTIYIRKLNQINIIDIKAKMLNQSINKIKTIHSYNNKRIYKTNKNIKECLELRKHLQIKLMIQ